MPPRTRGQRRGGAMPDASDGASAGPQVRINRGGGRRGRGRPRGRGGPVRDDRDQSLEGNVPPTYDIAGLVTSMQGLQRTVEALIGVITEQGRREGETHNRDPQGEGRQVNPQPPLPGGGTIQVSYSEFMKLKPPLFTGSDVSEDPQRFLDDMTRVCRALGCSSQRTVQLVEFRLQDVAQVWFETWMRGRPQGSPDVTWEEFSESFLERFLPESVRRARAKQFEELEQTPSMTVAEYDIQFTQLSRYAPHLVPTERMRIERFIDGLVRPLFRAVAPQMKSFPSYSAAVECAKMLEMKEMDVREKAKRTKFEGGFSGQSSGAQSKKSGPQAPKVVPQRPMGSITQSSASSQRERYDQRGFGPVSHQSLGPTEKAKPPCQICGRFHLGQCRQGMSGCYFCGQEGHLKRDCPSFREDLVRDLCSQCYHQPL